MIPGPTPPPSPPPVREFSASPTSSRAVVGTVNGFHEFVIQGFSLAKGMGVGKRITSDTFSVGGHKWTIRFYPDGIKPDHSEYVSAFLVLAGEDANVRALFEFVLVDQSGSGKNKAYSLSTRPLVDGPYKFESWKMWGYNRFYKRTDLEKSNFLKDDCLKINCTINVVVTWMDSSRPKLIKVPDPEMSLHMGMLLENQEGADIVFDVSGEKFHAHKLVLAARSPVFRTEFFDKLNDDKGEITITDMEPKVFKAMLHHIYKDTLLDDDVLATSSSYSSVSDTFAAKLLAAADKYELGRLRQLCQSYLCKNISVDSVSTIHELADRYHAEDLKAVCLKFYAGDLQL